TLPFQAAVAIYFVSRQLALGRAELVRATLKSGTVTTCSCAGVMVSVAFNDFSFTLPAFGFLAAAVTGLTGWWLGLVITGHPLHDIVPIFHLRGSDNRRRSLHRSRRGVHQRPFSPCDDRCRRAAAAQRLEVGTDKGMPAGFDRIERDNIVWGHHRRGRDDRGR